MQDYTDPAWRPTFERSGLDSFDAWWQLDAGWFEEPNRRRDGWSGVSRITLPLPDGTPAALFLKRQENHNTFSWRHPLRGIPTFAREFRHLMHYRDCQIATLEPVYFASRLIDGRSQAILATRELTGFVPLDTWRAASSPSPRTRLACIRAVAGLLRHMHRQHIQHNCLFAKHVFVRPDSSGAFEARVIDLEKSRWQPLESLCTLRDVDTLNRHSRGWSRTDRLRFIKAYLEIGHLTPEAKRLWRRLAARRATKRKGSG